MHRTPNRLATLFTAVLLAAAALLTGAPALAQSMYTDADIAPMGFGGAVSVMDGDIFVGSAPIGWPAGQDPAGDVYRYTRDADGMWTEAERITSPDAEFGDEFGRSVLASGGRLYVGAPAKGAVFVFEKQDGAWAHAMTLEPQNFYGEGFEFGGAYARGGYRTQTIAAFDGHTAVTSYNGDTNDGVVHVYDESGEQVRIIGANAWAIAGAGHHLFAGTPEAADGRGGLHVYGFMGDGALHAHVIDAADLDENARLGRSLAFVNGKLYAGAPGQNRRGAVYIFEMGDGGWNRTGMIAQPESDDVASSFGQSLSAHGTDLLVGANGSVFVYDTANPDAAPARIDRPEGQKGNGFGVGIGLGDGFLAVGAPSADYGWGLVHIYERSAGGMWSPATSVENDVTRMSSVTGGKVECEDGMVNDLFPCDKVDMVSFLSTGELANDRGANLNDIWGWTDPVTGTEYVLAGRTDGMSFVDISDPANPVVVGQMMRTPGSPGAWWRDIKTFGNYAYVVADGSGDHGMQIFDLTRLRDVDPADMPVDFEPDAVHTTLTSTHNIVINEETGYAYAVGSNMCGGQLHMMDLNEDPLHPVDLGCYNNDATGGTHDAQCVVYHGADQDYRGREICLNSNGSAFVIADVTDKSNPQTVAVAHYPNTAYTHQGWLSEDHNYFYMNDELDEMNKIVDNTRTLVWDVRDLEEPTLVNEFYHGNGASDHNLYVKGNYIFESNYQSGLRILDITDPVHPVEYAHFDTAPTADNVEGFGGSWSNYPYFESGIIAVSSQAEGLFLLRKQEVDL
jgi:choice-of-anchor B domain-containing protein